MEAKKSTINISRRAFLQTVGAAGAGLLLGENAMAQQNSRLSPEQQETVRKFLENPPPEHRICRSARKAVPMERALAEIVENIDPVLVSKYLVFSKDWLNIIGNDRNNQVTRQEFKGWTDTLDKVYECYKGFMDKGPTGGRDIIFVGQCENFGHAHANQNSLCLNPRLNSDSGMLNKIRKRIPTHVMLHEIGHVFTSAYTCPNNLKRNAVWVSNHETGAEFLVTYALEKGGFSMGYPTKVTGTQHRHGHINAAIRKMRDGTIKPFAYESDTAYDMYMFGLVDRVGWDTLKKAVQSCDFDNHIYAPTKTYDREHALPAHVHEFFDRVVYFHDQARELGKTDPKVLAGIPPAGRNMTGEQVLRSFPDRGKYLDEHFTVATTPIENVQQVAAPSSPATSTIAPTRLRVSTPNPGRVFVNEDVQQWNESTP